MICTLTIGSTVVDLAGYTGRSSETSGLSISTSVQAQNVAYIGTTEARQFWRPGSLVTASFTSRMSFDTVGDAEFYIANLPFDLIDQQDAVAVLARRSALGTKQVETATAAGTASASGNITVTVTSAIIEGSPIILTVPVNIGDDASDCAVKIQDAIEANDAIMRRFTLSGPLPNIRLTARRAAANDSTLNIAIANGSPSPGITPAATSANTTAGVADTLTGEITLYDAIAAVGVDAQGASVTLSATVTGRTTAP
jgi:hypothetical protein